MTYLSHLHVEGFKSIRTLDLDLRSLNVLVGANGSGKSNLLALFRLLNAIADRRLQLHTALSGADSFLYFGRQATPSITLMLEFHENTEQDPSSHPVASAYTATLMPGEDNTLTFDGEITVSLNVNTSPYPDYNVEDQDGGHPESRLPIRTDPLSRRIYGYLIGCKLYHFEDTSATAKVKGLGDIELGAVLNEDASNLAAFLYTMREVQRPYYDRLVSVIRSVAPFIDDFILAPRALNNAQIQLRWRHVGQEGEFTAHALSDGTLRFICLAALLLQPKLPPLILLDEPELGLHPHAVDMIGSLLKSAAARTQLIVATQSVTLVDQMDFSDILIAERAGNESQFHWLDSETHLRQWLEDYSLGQMWDMNLYGGTTPAARETQP